MELEVNIRNESIKPKKLRKQGKVPGIIYGKDFPNQLIYVDKKELKEFLKNVESSDIIDINIKGKGKEKVLIKEIDKDPVSEDYIHIDFHRIKMDEEIETIIKLNFIGEPKAKEKGGIVLIQKEFLKVRCLPKYLVSRIDIDLSSLENLNDVLYVKDIKVPYGIEVLDDDTEVIVTIKEEEKQEEVLEEEKTVEDVEVVEKGKLKQEEDKESEE